MRDIPCHAASLYICVLYAFMWTSVIGWDHKSFYSSLSDFFPCTNTYIVTCSRCILRKSGVSGDKAARQLRASRDLLWPLSTESRR